MNRTDYPTLNGPSPDCGGATLTPADIDRVAAWFKSDEYRAQREESERYYEAERRYHWERIEQWWLRENGATVMTKKLRDELDEMCYQWMLEHTNISEML